MPVTTPVTDLGALPRANVLSAKQIETGPEYEHIPDVAVFAEHTTTARDGRTLTFGPKELQAIADNCNRRIEESGDFAAVSVMHTPNQPGGDMPNEGIAIGYAGPFRLGQLRDRVAILADFHVRREHRDDLKNYPRRSPELWLAADYKDMYFDPISLLGAEAPRLDLGPMPYAKRRHPNGQLVEIYSASCASATSGFVWGTDAVGKKKPERYEADGQPKTLEPEDLDMDEQAIQQIIQALEQLDVFQWARQKMTEEAGQQNQPAGEPDGDEPAPEIPTEELPAAVPGVPPAEPQPEKEKDMKPGMPERYQKLQGEVDSLKAELAAIREVNVNGARIATLKGIRAEHAFDFDKAVEQCKYSKMSDAAFAETCEHFRNYPGIPTGAELPEGEVQRPERKQPEKFSKAQADAAIKWSAEQAAAGNNVTWDQAKAHILAAK